MKHSLGSGENIAPKVNLFNFSKPNLKALNINSSVSVL